MEHLFIIANYPKEDVIAGLACSMIALTSEYRDVVKVNEICKKIGIKMSTVQSQIKRNLIEKYHISGFTSLVHSADLLEKIVKKLTGISINKEARLPRAVPEKKPKNRILKFVKKIFQVRPHAEKVFAKDEIDDMVMIEDGFTGKISFVLLTENGIIEIMIHEEVQDSLISNKCTPSREKTKLYLHDLTTFEGKGPPRCLYYTFINV